MLSLIKPYDWKLSKAKMTQKYESLVSKTSALIIWMCDRFRVELLLGPKKKGGIWQLMEIVAGRGSSPSTINKDDHTIPWINKNCCVCLLWYLSGHDFHFCVVVILLHTHTHTGLLHGLLVVLDRFKNVLSNIIQKLSRYGKDVFPFWFIPYLILSF